MDNRNSISVYTEEITKVLEPSLIFVNGGYGHNVSHHVDYSFVELFSYLVAYVIMPILTGIVSNKLSNHIHLRGGNKVKLGIEDGYMTVIGEKEFSDENVITMKELADIKKDLVNDDKLLANSPINSNKSEEALEALTELLVSNGWPQKIARFNAEKIIKNIINLKK